MTRRRVLIALVVLVGGIVFAARRSATATSEIPQPLEWVPFSADFALVHSGTAHQPSSGRLFRSDDGSTRIETWLAGAPERHVISIRNIAQAKYYSKRWNREWISAPMELPVSGWKPLRVRAASAGLSLYRYKLALRAGEDGSLASTDGFTAYQFVNNSGNLWLMVPELNFYPVVKQWVLTGRRELLSNVQIGDQDPELFVPPRDVYVEETLVPRGITSRRR